MTIAEINNMPEAQFVEQLGPVFEHSPWVASRAFVKPKNGRIAVKVINHLGDEVMKVFKVV